MGLMTRRITTTYAYHPASDEPDLELPTSVVGYYLVSPGMVGRRPIAAALQSSISAQGVLSPVKIYTDGVFAKLGDGHHRLKIASSQGIPTMPVQVIPDAMKRSLNRVALEPELAAWIEGNLWIHETHEVSRRLVGQRKTGLMGNAYTMCECSCGAQWKETR
jgi:hypothetical protein